LKYQIQLFKLIKIILTYIYSKPLIHLFKFDLFLLYLNLIMIFILKGLLTLFQIFYN